jgi:hypothetical protein
LQLPLGDQESVSQPFTISIWGEPELEIAIQLNMADEQKLLQWHYELVKVAFSKTTWQAHFHPQDRDSLPSVRYRSIQT